MNQVLKERLRENEQVVWQGKPEDIKLFEKPFPGRIFTMWAVSVLLLVFTGWYSFSYGPAKELEPTLLRNVGIFCTVLAAYIAVSPFLAIRKMHNKVAYCITTERFIAYTPNSKSPRFQFREFDDFTEVTVEKLSTGKYNMYIGPISKGLRGRSRDGVINYNDTMKMDPLVFTSISDPQGACACLPDHITIHGDDVKMLSSNAA